MIVKNEMANLERCLTAVAPHISCWVIGDTGSTDGSREFVRCFFAQRNIPGELYSYPFINFAQARNEALDRARASTMDFDYLLLVDADLELMVHAPAFSRDLTSAADTVRQHHGITYRNIRLLRRDAQASYRGVTHEFLAVRSGETGNLDDICLLDHPTGSNRKDSLYESGYVFAAQGLTMARPDDALFPEDWIYDYGLRDELAVCAYWTGRYAECRDACDRLISEGKIPAEYRARVSCNRHVAAARLGEIGTAPSTRDGLNQGTVLA
jgi:glycosyltransferase involved in cell wall biosynthesis